MSLSTPLRPLVRPLVRPLGARLHLMALAALAAAALMLTPPAQAGYEVNVGQGLTMSGVAGGKPALLALRGYDPVAYFTDGKPRLGTSAHGHVHRGAAYWFVSEANKKTFAADPAKYAPQYGGFCAYGVANGMKFDGDPHLWKVAGGKLYLNVAPEIQSKWLQEVPGNVAKADTNWGDIRTRSPQDLWDNK